MAFSANSLETTPETIEDLMEGILCLIRILWRQRISGSTDQRRSGAEELSALLARECEYVTRDVRTSVVQAWRSVASGDIAPAGAGPHPNFDSICRAALPEDVCSEDARYFAMRSIRRRYHLRLSSDTAAAAHHLARAASDLLERSPGREISFEELNRAMKNRVRSDDPQERAMEAGLRKAFVDISLMFNLFEFSNDGAKVSLRPESIDPEYMINHLFGMSTAITGFDALFGGGGLMMADTVKSRAIIEQLGMDEKQGIGGRSILCIGPFGSGKTLLSLQFAVEVARKGGVSWVMTLEQSVEECLYALESVGVSTRHPSFTVADGLAADTLWVLSHPAPTRGALVFLRPSQDQRDNYKLFLEWVQDRFDLMSSYPLRLLVVDPINALHKTEPLAGVSESWTTNRSYTRKMFEYAKSKRVSVWFTSEQTPQEQESNHFAENIADTVIHLGTENNLGQQKRYIEITKSRFQQESSGRHGLTIKSNGGIHIHPSTTLLARASALVARHISARPVETGIAKLRFGVLGIERLLGPEPIRPGDVIALTGPGKAKTMLGIKFLLAQAQDRCSVGVSLLISDYSSFQAERLLATIGGADLDQGARAIELCTLPTGYVDPGEILEEIRSAFERCRRKGLQVTRTLLTNLARWEEEMPFIAEDRAFGIALVTLIRSYRAAAVVVCGDSEDRGSRLRATIYDQADTLLQFQRRELQGRVSTLLTAVKTRSMRHQREVFELAFESTGVEVRPMPLVRLKPSGDVVPLKISLFLHTETQNHEHHNEQMAGALKAMISADTKIEDQSQRFDPSLLSVSQYSAVDELQILQLDEFQLPLRPAASYCSAALYAFDTAMNADLLEGRLPVLIDDKVFLEHRSLFLAVPFYANLSFLAVHNERYESMRQKMKFTRFPESWRELADQCSEWDEAQPESDELLFACPVYRNGLETYSCLFYEILDSLQPLDCRSVDLAVWLDHPSAIDAAYLFWLLCRKAYRREHVPAHPPAAIYRHWYNTLNQELWEMEPQERDQISVKSLFGDRTTAGEWYLAIPAHSASPEIGLHLIEQLTSSDREILRADLGVALPTRVAYYQGKDAEIESVSKYFNFPRAKAYWLLRNAIRRSEFKHYQRFSYSISSHLNSLLEISVQKGANKPSAAVKPEIERVMKNLASNLRFLSHDVTRADDMKNGTEGRFAQAGQPS